MKQHNVIYVPTDEVIDNGFGVFRAPDFEATDYVGEVKEECNVIVLSVEDLKEVFGAGMDYGRNIKNQTLKEYLQSKGITL